MRLIKIFTFTFTGYLHTKNNEPCQDFCAHLVTENCAAAALADGAGSARLSHIGARVATTTFTGYITAKPERIFEDPELIINRVRLNLERNAKKRGVQISDLSSTLLGTAFYDGNLFLLHIGDGKALLISEGGAEILSEGKKGEFSNETYFTTSRDPNPEVVRRRIAHPHPFSVILMSDGACSLFLDMRGKKPAPVLHSIISLMDSQPQEKIRRSLKRALKNIEPHRRHDDISLAIMKFGGGLS